MSEQTRLPLYIQLSELITREISSGRLLDGEKLPPERQMAKNLNTTVRTLRKALDELTKKGLVQRKQGSGNYIRASATAESVYSFFRVELIEGGGLPTADILSVDRLGKPAEAPEFGPSKDAYRIRRLRFLNEQPSALEEIWLDSSCADDMSADELSESLYLYYKNTLKLWITRAEDQVSIKNVPQWAPQEFGLEPNTLSTFVERISWSQENKAVEYSRNWINQNKARYVARIK